MPKISIEEGIKEIYKALENGTLKVDDKYFTVKWYKKLIEEGNNYLVNTTDV